LRIHDILGWIRIQIRVAIAAKYHGIPFFTALPTSTIDLTKSSGIEIHVEERPAHELTR
jgi:methylthioribose-1-phosphate isomerase